jgi:hypothetical protein
MTQTIEDRAQKRLEAAAPQMLEALTRALFILESPVLAGLANGAGTLDFVRETIRLVNDDPDMRQQP